MFLGEIFLNRLIYLGIRPNEKGNFEIKNIFLLLMKLIEGTLVKFLGNS